MKKLLFAILLILTLSVSLIACGGSDNGAEYISLSKTSSHSPSMTVSPGGEIVYSVTLTNSDEDAHTVTVNDSVPTGCELVSGDFTIDEGALSCEVALEAGESKTVSYTVRVLQDNSLTAYSKIVATAATLEEKTATCNDIFVGYTFGEGDKARITDAIAAISYSKDIDAATLARQIYNVAFSNVFPIYDSTDLVISEMFRKNPRADGYQYLAMSVPTLYGGKNISGTVNDGFKGESALPTPSDLIIGDLLLVKTQSSADFYIFDGENLILLNSGYEISDVGEIISSLAEAEQYAVLRPSLTFYQNIGYEALNDTSGLTDEQIALVETARAYFWRGYRLQYDDTRMPSTTENASDNGEFRWQIGAYQPEDYTEEKWGFINCAAFTYDLYRTALGMDLGNLYTTSRLASYYASGAPEGVAMYPYNCLPQYYKDADVRAAEMERFLSTLKVGDLIVVRRNNGSGHVMMYIGNNTVIHSSGASFDYSNDSETYEPSIRYMNIVGYLFEEDAKNYVFADDGYVTQLCIVRPLDIYDGKIPENTVNRVENLKDILSEKLSSHKEGMTVNQGENIVYTFKIKNHGKSAKTLTVSDVVPEGTVLVLADGATVDGENLTWQITVNAGETALASYTVCVTAENGAYIYGDGATVGGVKHTCPGVYVKTTLSAEDQAKIVAAVEKFKANNPDMLSGTDLVNAIYLEAGLSAPFVGSDAEMRDSLFVSKPNTTGNSTVWYHNTESVYYEMIAPTLYGGRRFFTPQKYTETEKVSSDRSRLPREQGLVIGDILVTKFLSSEGMYMYVGDGVFVNLYKTNLSEDAYSVSVRLMRMISAGNYYVVLRPSTAS